MSDQSGFYVWLDTEFTSLDLDSAKLLQVALMVTDARLNRVKPPGEDLNLVLRLDPGCSCDPWVEQNLPHLLRRCRSAEGLAAEEVDARIAAHLESVFGAPAERVKERPVLAGNSLHSDWFLARRYLPSLIRRVNYRLLDVSSWKVYWNNGVGASPFDKENLELIRQYFPGEFAARGAAHDAYFDIHASIAEMNYYHRHLKIVAE